MDVRVDTGELTALAADFTRAGAAVGGRVFKATERAARRTRDDARRLVAGLAHAPHYPRSITYDLQVRPTSIHAEVGPDKDLRQGALGNLLEFGSANNAPLAHLGPAFDRAVPDWLDDLERDAGRL